MSVMVIGAGFAGLSAAYHLAQAGQAVTVLEARERIGGRAHTRYDFAGIPVEFGAELIHGAEVVTWEWVDKLGLETVHWAKLEDSLVRLADGEMLTMLAARQKDPDFDITRRWNLPPVPAEAGETWAAYLRRIGFSEAQMDYVRRSFCNAVGEDATRLSARAMLIELAENIQNPDLSAYASDDYRILGGYAQIYNTLAQGLDIRLNTVVTEIAWDDGGVSVISADGERWQAAACVLTLPLGVLKAGAVRFKPGLPQIKQEALAGLEMGPVMKMVYKFDQPITPPGVSAIYSAHNPPMWWSPTYGRSPGYGRSTEGESDTVWTAFFSGDYARELLAMGEEAALQHGLNVLRAELQQPELQYAAAQWVNWPADPYALGGYSHVLPGQEDARAKLAAATPPLYWAGEAAASHEAAATVHGAYETGKRAAQQILGL